MIEITIQNLANVSPRNAEFAGKLRLVKIIFVEVILDGVKHLVLNFDSPVRFGLE